MEKIGVEAVVEGLAGFLGDMKKMDSAISGLVPGTKLLENAFGFLGNTIDGFVNFTLNTLAHALGELVADAIEFVIQKIGEFVQSSIELGSELQRLKVELTNLNLPSSVDDIKDWNKALSDASEASKEQLEWLQKLAVVAPFGPAQIADIYTAARTMDLADDEAKQLTKSILEFAAGFNLGNVEAERIILNLRQMGARGKITGRELSDLARGAKLPLEDVMQRIADIKNAMEGTTLTAADVMAEISAPGAGLPVDLFIQAFEQMTKEEPRFAGAMGRLGKTVKFASQNFKEFLTTLGGSIITPILDVIGKRISTITDQFVTFSETGDLISTKKWDRVKAAVDSIGASITSLISTALGFAPSAESIADEIVKSFEGIADWFKKHRSDITDWIITSSRWINNVLIPDIQRVVRWLFGTSMEKGAIQKFGQWLEETFMPLLGKVWNWVKETLVPFMEDKLPGLLDALGSLGDSILEVIGAIFDNEKTTDTSWVDDLTTGIKDFATWVSENKDTIAQWVERLVTATVYLAILISLLSTAVGWIATITAAFFNWWVISDPLAKALLAIGLAIAGWNLLTLIAPLLLIIALIAGLELDWALLKAFFLEFVTVFKAGWKDMADNAAESVQRIKDAIQSGDWIQVGLEIVRSVAQAILDFGWMIGDALVSAVNKSFNQLTSLIGLPDMSVLLPGSNSTMAGSSVNSNTTNTNNYNLNINSSAQHEPIVQDFFMMQSFHGR